MPSYIRLLDQRYPLSEYDIRLAHPNVSFPVPFSPTEDYAVVFPAPQPSHDPLIRVVRETAPVLTEKGHWEQRWAVVPRFTEYTDPQGVLHTVAEQEEAAIAADRAQRAEAVKASIVAATQARLDQFARTRGYDGILSACTYASSPTWRFANEGQYCVVARDETWSTLYQILNEVLAGSRPMPAQYSDIEGALPPLTWPE